MYGVDERKGGSDVRKREIAENASYESLHILPIYAPSCLKHDSIAREGR
jgi:hypothetical protein